jgi:hypothetical protein
MPMLQLMMHDRDDDGAGNGDDKNNDFDHGVEDKGDDDYYDYDDKDTLSVLVHLFCSPVQVCEPLTLRHEYTQASRVYYQYIVQSIMSLHRHSIRPNRYDLHRPHDDRQWWWWWWWWWGLVVGIIDHGNSITFSQQSGRIHRRHCLTDLILIGISNNVAVVIIIFAFISSHLCPFSIIDDPCRSYDKPSMMALSEILLVAVIGILPLPHPSINLSVPILDSYDFISSLFQHRFLHVSGPTLPNCPSVLYIYFIIDWPTLRVVCPDFSTAATWQFIIIGSWSPQFPIQRNHTQWSILMKIVELILLERCNFHLLPSCRSSSPILCPVTWFNLYLDVLLDLQNDCMGLLRLVKGLASERSKCPTRLTFCVYLKGYSPVSNFAQPFSSTDGIAHSFLVVLMCHSGQVSFVWL